MANLVFGLNGSGVVNGSRSFTVSDADVTRLINAFRPEAQRASGSDEVPVTDAQVLLHWARSMVADTKAYVKRYEERAPSVSEIGITE
jgi:hypothetical protein